MIHVAYRYEEVDDVLEGLRAPRKHLPCRLLYDATGADLFEQICTLDAYYPTRIELALLDDHVAQIASNAGRAARVIEPGSGAALKTRKLLAALDHPSVYIPIDVAHEQMHRAAARLRSDFPGLAVEPVTADYTQPFELPSPQHAFARTLVFFPGSTIGNFEPRDASAFLARLGRIAGDDRLLLLGADSTRDPRALIRAYDDEDGVTAAFDQNVLRHVNRTCGANFDPDAFEHRAIWNAAASRVEMHLVSTRRQTVELCGESIRFLPGESIVTEHCYKHTPDALQALLAMAGWTPRQVFTSSQRPYRLWLCEAGR
jgi:L-histidine N-alpha-methyltransferase